MRLWSLDLSCVVRVSCMQFEIPSWDGSLELLGFGRSVEEFSWQLAHWFIFAVTRQVGFWREVWCGGTFSEATFPELN